MTGAAQPKGTQGDRFLAAADALAGTAEDVLPSTLTFLQALGFRPRAAVDDAVRDHRVKMLRRAAGFDRFFRLDSPIAPGARFCGASEDASDDLPAGNFAGRGFDLGSAFLSCVGEAAEFNAVYLRPNDPRVVGERITGRSLLSGVATTSPTKNVLRQKASNQPTSTGYAAGPTLNAAIESALLECVERDAIARWSEGETRPSVIDITPGLERAIEAAGRIAARPVQFAEMTPDGGLAHAVVAVSHDDALGTALGFGAAFDLETACVKALLELCQGEIGLLMIARKRREAGQLSDRETVAHERSRTLRPGAGKLAFADSRGGKPGPDTFEAAIATLASRNQNAVAYDLTLPDDRIPVATVKVEGMRDAAESSEDGTLSLL